jgi:hypothetical protein
MAKVQTSCPRCRQPIAADVEQLFDLNVDPQAKQKILNGSVNVANCPNCGYNGMLSTPMVYHDPEKELLLTYFPPELGMQLNEQEKLLGPMINQVTNKLPMEKRKAYLLRPQAMLTYQTMLEKILEADGITKEMLDDQQKKLALLQRLLSIPEADRLVVIKQEEVLIDETFFGIINRLIEATLAQGDQQTAKALAALQQELVQNTEVGKKIKEQSEEVQAAVKSLQEASQAGLTREKLLDLIIAAPTEIRFSTLVSYTRSGMDYEFFQVLTQRIEKTTDEAERKHLEEVREKLLAITQQIDKAIEKQMVETRKLLETILAASNIEETTVQHFEEIDELFIQTLQAELQVARQKADLERIARLNKVAAIIEKASAPPPEVNFLEELASIENDEERQKLIEANQDMLNDNFMALLNNLIAQSSQQAESEEVARQLQSVYRQILRFKMQQNLKK